MAVIYQIKYQIVRGQVEPFRPSSSHDDVLEEEISNCTNFSREAYTQHHELEGRF